MKTICRDLYNEYAALDDLVLTYSREGWLRVTPFYGWTIKDQISHLAYFDRAAYLSATDEDGFNKHLEAMLRDFVSFDELHRSINAQGGSLPVPDLLAEWRSRRSALLDAYSRLEPKTRLPWYGPTMSARSSATARLMESWAHGQDIRDCLGIEDQGSDRLKHIAHLGYATFDWSFVNRGMEPPDVPVRLELTSPGGETWTWGEVPCDNRIRGRALDFCRVIIQRRHVNDTDLTVEGGTARQWMRIVQVFAGPPETGPETGERVNTATKNHTI